MLVTILLLHEVDSGRSFQPAPVSNTIVGPASANFNASGTSKGVPDLSQHQDAPKSTPSVKTQSMETPTIFVAGALAVDFNCDYAPTSSAADKIPVLQTSNPAQISQSLGGVAHNVARAAHLMGGPVRLCSIVGDDLAGKAALQALSSEGLDQSGIKIQTGGRTAQYVAVNDANKDLVMAMADMNILNGTSSQPLQKEDNEDDPFTSFWLPQLRSTNPTHVVLDANWTPVNLSKWLSATTSLQTPYVSFEPVSTAKASRIFQFPPSSGSSISNNGTGNPITTLSTFPNPTINLSTPNALELSAMHSAARSAGLFDREDWWAVIDALGIPSTGARVAFAQAATSALVDAGVPQQSVQLLPFIPSLAVKLGAQGVLLTQLLPAGDERLHRRDYAPYILSRCSNGSEDSLGVGGVYMRLFGAAEAVPEGEVVSVNGVGDTFLGALIAGLAGREAAVVGKMRVEDFVDVAQRAAVLTLKSPEAVSEEIRGLRSSV